MKKLVLLAAALSACSLLIAPGVFARPRRAPATAPLPVVTAQPTTRFTEDNGGPYSSGQTSAPVNNYLSVSTAELNATNCNSGVPSTPFGLPCTGSGTTVASGVEWWQGVSFVTPGNIPNGVSWGEMVGAGTGGTNAATGNCGGGNDKCIGLVNVSTNYEPPYALIELSFLAQNARFWPSTCAPLTLYAYPAHRYTLFYGSDGTGTGYPVVALVDGVTGAVQEQTCASSMWASGAFIGASGSTNTIAHTTPILYVGGVPGASGTWKAGWGGSAGPVFAYVGPFPSQSTLIAIATGQQNLLTNPPAGSTCQAYYSLADVGTWADSCHHYDALTQTVTTALTDGPPAIAPAAVTINEKIGGGFTYRIDPSTISMNASRQICYAGSPATGTVNRSGTWAAQPGGVLSSGLTHIIFNAAGAIVAQHAVTPLPDGTWTDSISGIPWGAGYTDEIEWNNSPGASGRSYKSSIPFNVGLSFGIDGQSESIYQTLVGNTGDMLTFNGAGSASVFQIATPGQGSMQDDAGKYPVLSTLTSYNTPGSAANPAGMQGFYLDFSQHAQAIGDGATAFLETAQAESGCPVMAAYFGRNGHSREDFAYDHVALSTASPNPNVPAAATYSVSGASLITNANITVSNYATFLTPGTISIEMTYTGGATVTGKDNGAGVITFDDGSTGKTNYGFNGLTTDTPALASALGFAAASSNSDNGVGYWFANDCRPTAGASSCPGYQGGDTATGVVKGNTTFAATTTAIGSFSGATITGATWASTGGGQATFTVSSNLTTTLGPGSIIAVSGITPTGYNGSWTVLSLTSTAVTVSLPGASSPGTYSSGGSITSVTGHLCINQPNIPDALWHLCSNGSGTGTLSGQEVAITLGSTTIGTVISDINAMPSASFVTATLNGTGGTSGLFELVPTAGYPDIVITPASTCDTTCQAGIVTSWTTDLETNPSNSGFRGEKLTGGSAAQIPDGFGVFGDSVNCNSGHVSAILCKIRAPFSTYIEVIGASDTNPTYSAIQEVENELWDHYALATNADPNTPIVIIGYHRSMVSTFKGSDYDVYTNTRQVTQQLGLQGGRYYYGGDVGLYDVVSDVGPHPSNLPGGGWLWGQGVGESWLDAVAGSATLSHATSYSSGGTWSSAAFTQQTTWGGQTFSQCATANACIVVTATLGTGDSKLTTAGGLTAASGSGPTSCPAWPNTVTDGDVTFYCIGPVTARVDGATATIGEVLNGSPTDLTSPYSGGFLFQVTTAGTLGTGTITSSNYVGTTSGLTHASFKDGSAWIAYLGLGVPYVNNLQLAEGMTMTAGGNAYVAVGFNVANPVGRSCMGFSVIDSEASGNPIGPDGWDPVSHAFDGPTYSCTIVSATQVLLARTSGTWTAKPGTSIVYGSSYPSQRYQITISPGEQPIDQQALGEWLTGDRGYKGLANQTAPGAHIQPLLAVPMIVQ